MHDHPVRAPWFMNVMSSWLHQRKDERQCLWLQDLSGDEPAVPAQEI
jgi:hypothetical protein